MADTNFTDHPSPSGFRNCGTRSVTSALESGKIKIEGLLSPQSEGLNSKFILSNSLPYQYAHWGRIALTSVADKMIRTNSELRLMSGTGIVVTGHDAMISAEADSILELNTQFIQSHKETSLFRREADRLFIRNEPPIHFSEPALLGFTPSSENYAHWLTESLPLWWVFANFLSGIKLILGPETKFQREALQLLGISPESVIRIPNNNIVFEKLFFSEPVSLWSPPMLVGEAGRNIAKLAGAEPGLRKRLYVSREDADQRKLLNESKLLDGLSKIGFEKVLCSHLSFPEQAKLFGSAEFVIGPHGAALANALFCPAGSQFIEVFPEYCVQPHFRALASRANLDYGMFLGTSFEYENSRNSGNAWEQDFVIDTEALIQAVHHLIRDKSQ